MRNFKNLDELSEYMIRIENPRFVFGLPPNCRDTESIAKLLVKFANGAINAELQFEDKKQTANGWVFIHKTYSGNHEVYIPYRSNCTPEDYDTYDQIKIISFGGISGQATLLPSYKRRMTN